LTKKSGAYRGHEGRLQFQEESGGTEESEKSDSEKQAHVVEETGHEEGSADIGLKGVSI